MEPLFEALYSYAVKHRCDACVLPDEEERLENERMIDLAREELYAKGLGGAADRLEDGLITQNMLDRRRAFRAGLSIGLELTRL